MRIKDDFFTVGIATLLFAGSFLPTAFAQPFPPGGTNGGGGSYTNYLNPYFSGPGLKLNTPIIEGTNLHLFLLEPDLAGAYDIYFSTNVNSSSWSNLVQGTTGQTNFVVQMPLSETTFFRVRRSDPIVTNAATITAIFPSGVVQSTNVSPTIIGGPAAATAILINDMNFDGATWVPFSSIPNINLGSGDQPYQVWFGFYGSDGFIYWSMIRIRVDTTPPLLVITNPVSNIGSQSLIQLQGYSPEPLASISFDVTNAAGHVITNESGYILERFYDTNQFSDTTNWFQCFDVGLTNGTNTIIVRAVDRAGNVTITNLSYIFDPPGDSNAPSLALHWPKNGGHISGSELRVRGLMDDPSAQIAAQIVSSNGVTNTVSGLVERDGLFWAGQLPLADGANNVTIIATDAAGNIATTNITVTKSMIDITVDEISSANLWQDAIAVSGTISVTDHAVWLNGRQATLDGNNWSVDNVPINPDETAIVQIRAIPLADNGGNGNGDAGTVCTMANPGNPNSTNASDHDLDIGKPSKWWLESFDYSATVVGASPDGAINNFSRLKWNRLAESSAFAVRREPGLTPISMATTWAPAYEPTNSGTSITINLNNQNTTINTNAAPAETSLQHTEQVSHHCFNTTPVLCGDWTENSDAMTTLFTGGKKLPNKKSLFELTAQASSIPGFWEFPAVSTNIPWTQISLPQGPVDSNYTVYAVLPDGITVDFTPIVTSNKNYSFSEGSRKLDLELSAVTFSATNGYHDILIDGLIDFIPGLPYPSPHWNKTNRSPALFAAGSRMQATAEFSISKDSSLFGVPLVFKGETDYGITFWGTNVASASGVSVLTTASEALTPLKVDFFDPLEIQWSYAIPDRTDFIPAGSSTNPVYVSWGSSTAPHTMHTLVHLACVPAKGQTIESNIVEAIWQTFPSLSVRRLEGTEMSYWLNEEEPQFDSASLILRADGACGAWASLFYDALKIHDIESTFMGIYPPLTAVEIGICSNIPAQGNPTPKNNFINHAVVERGTVIYDPSYGKKFTSRLAWEDDSVCEFYEMPNAGNPTNDVKGVLETRWDAIE